MNDETYTLTDDDGDKLEVRKGRSFAVVSAERADGRLVTVYVTKDAAPALVLAILEGAGVKDIGDGRVSHVVRELRAVLADQAKAAEDAKLDEEAAAYRAAWHGADGSFATWGDLSPTTKETWRAVVRKAHELHGKAAS